MRETQDRERGETELGGQGEKRERESERGETAGRERPSARTDTNMRTQRNT